MRRVGRCPGASRAGRRPHQGRCRNAAVRYLRADRQAGALGRRARRQGDQRGRRREGPQVRAPVRGRRGQSAGRGAQSREASPAGQGRSADRHRQQRIDARGRPACRAQPAHPGHHGVLRALDHRRAMQPERVPRERQRLHAVERADQLADQERVRQALLLHRPRLRDGPQHHRGVPGRHQAARRHRRRLDLSAARRQGLHAIHGPDPRGASRRDHDGDRRQRHRAAAHPAQGIRHPHRRSSRSPARPAPSRRRTSAPWAAPARTS